AMAHGEWVRPKSEGFASHGSKPTGAAHGRDPWAGWRAIASAMLADNGPRLRSAGSAGGKRSRRSPPHPRCHAGLPHGSTPSDGGSNPSQPVAAVCLLGEGADDLVLLGGEGRLGHGGDE